jgi:membrane-bound lytic murein transglycosylase D
MMETLKGIIGAFISVRAVLWRWRRLCGSLLLIAACGQLSLIVARAASQSDAFPIPACIQSNVKFWIDVFTRYSARDFVLHDKEQIARVYEVFHLDGYGDPSPSEVEWVNAYLKAKYQGLLSNLARGWPPLGSDEQRVAELFHDEPITSYLQAIDNLRVQQGMRERFRAALVRGDFYQPVLKRELIIEGLPTELAILPSVESGFYLGARSHAGAVGLWQLTRPAARENSLVVRRYYDERFDVVRSTDAAARILRLNYERFGNWPLAMTAYIYGTNGIAEAVNIYGNDFEKIYTRFKGPHFGFASRNYYAEFLAALQIDQNKESYFPGIREEIAATPPPDFEPPPPPRIARVHYAMATSAHHSYLRHAAMHSHSRGHHYSRHRHAHHRRHHSVVTTRA